MNFVIAKVEVVFIWFVDGTVNFEDIFEENVINVENLPSNFSHVSGERH